MVARGLGLNADDLQVQIASILPPIPVRRPEQLSHRSLYRGRNAQVVEIHVDEYPCGRTSGANCDPAKPNILGSGEKSSLTFLDVIPSLDYGQLPLRASQRDRRSIMDRPDSSA
jgi:hypothetical protein